MWGKLIDRHVMPIRIDMFFFFGRTIFISFTSLLVVSPPPKNCTVGTAPFVRHSFISVTQKPGITLFHQCFVSAAWRWMILWCPSSGPPKLGKFASSFSMLRLGLVVPRRLVFSVLLGCDGLGTVRSFELGCPGGRTRSSHSGSDSIGCGI